MKEVGKEVQDNLTSAEFDYRSYQSEYEAAIASEEIEDDLALVMKYTSLLNSKTYDKLDYIRKYKMVQYDEKWVLRYNLCKEASRYFNSLKAMTLSLSIQSRIKAPKQISSDRSEYSLTNYLVKEEQVEVFDLSTDLVSLKRRSLNAYLLNKTQIYDDSKTSMEELV